MTSTSNFSHAATVFPVSNMEESITFYTQKLGFKLDFQWGTPVSYVVLNRGGVSIHLTQKEDAFQASTNHCALYIFVHDIDTLYKEYQEHNVNIKSELGDRDYKMRDFDIITPEGYIITFGNGY